MSLWICSLQHEANIKPNNFDTQHYGPISWLEAEGVLALKYYLYQIDARLQIRRFLTVEPSWLQNTHDQNVYPFIRLSDFIAMGTRDIKITVQGRRSRTDKKFWFVSRTQVYTISQTLAVHILHSLEKDWRSEYTTEFTCLLIQLPSW